MLTKKKMLYELQGSFRTDVNGWIRIHIQGDPRRAGFQHGYLLAREIKDTKNKISNLIKTACKKSWSQCRNVARKFYLPKIPRDILVEIQAIADGVDVRGVKGVDFLDIISLNGFYDTLTYFIATQDKDSASLRRCAAHCSAFMATGNYTSTGEIIFAHSMWAGFISPVNNVIMSITPSKGNKILMETMPASIHGSGVDVYVNSAGMMITNTTLTGVKTFNAKGTPYFVRARKALQYATSIDKWIEIFLKDNNGGDPSGWFVGDAKTGDIAYIEVATHNHAVKRTNNGFFPGCNMAYDPKVRTETTVNYKDKTTSTAARDARWRQLMKRYKGKINIEVAKKFMADHFDATVNKDNPSSRTLCGHLDNDPQGWPEWGIPPYAPYISTSDAVATSSSLALNGEMWAHWGRPCGMDFNTNNFINNHPEYSQHAPIFQDLIAYPWTLFSAWSDAK